MDIPNNPTPEDIWRAFQKIGPFATGRVLDAITVGTSSTPVKHFLGRVPQYWVELNPQNGAALVKEAAAPDSTYLYLIASSAVTSSLLVW